MTLFSSFFQNIKHLIGFMWSGWIGLVTQISLFIVKSSKSDSMGIWKSFKETPHPSLISTPSQWVERGHDGVEKAPISLPRIVLSGILISPMFLRMHVLMLNSNSHYSWVRIQPSFHLSDRGRYLCYKAHISTQLEQVQSPVQETRRRKRWSQGPYHHILRRQGTIKASWIKQAMWPSCACMNMFLSRKPMPSRFFLPNVSTIPGAYI